MSSLAATVAPDLLWLDVARVVQGAGAAAIMVNGIPLLSDRYTGEERDLAIGAWGSFATAAGLLAPVFGGVLAETFGWRAVFAVNLPLGVAAWVLAVRVLPHAPGTAGETSRSPARTDRLGSLLLMLGLGTATLLVLRSGDTPWSGQDTAVLLTACAALAAFPAVQLKVPAPTLELRMFGSPAFSGAMLAVLLSRVLTIGGSVYLVLYFSDGLGMSPTGAGRRDRPAHPSWRSPCGSRPPNASAWSRERSPRSPRSARVSVPRRRREVRTAGASPIRRPAAGPSRRSSPVRTETYSPERSDSP
nr:MFS transporter [Streptomyces parvus]